MHVLAFEISKGTVKTLLRAEGLASPKVDYF